MLQPIIQAISTHIITGFLGAGKTTLLNALLQQKPVGETWAVLMNEFGQIGVDQAFIQQQDGIAVKEVVGGCLCCTSQLPMQIALARLLTSVKPDRLFIEPTGLGHPDQLIEQLSEPHWLKALSLRAVVTVVNGGMLQDSRLITHETFISQLQVADIVLVSNRAAMSAHDQDLLHALKQRFAKEQQQWQLIEQGNIEFDHIDIRRAHTPVLKRSLVHLPASYSATPPQPITADEVSLPYHYVEAALGQEVGGWRLPAAWQFKRNQLLNCLMDVDDWLRIKGVVRVEDGWVSINLVPFKMSFNSHDGYNDNRLEIIGGVGRDWQQLEEKLMGCLVED